MNFIVNEHKTTPLLIHGNGNGVTGIVYNEGLLLAKIPLETIAERNAYYSSKNQQAKEALDNNMFNESAKDGRYVKYDSQRKSNVTFGKK